MIDPSYMCVSFIGLRLTKTSLTLINRTSDQRSIHMVCGRLFATFFHIPRSTWGDIFECFSKAQSSKLEHLFSLKRGKRDVRALSFELSKMSPQVGWAVQPIPLGVTFSKAFLFTLIRGKRDVRVLSFELSKMSPQVGLAVLPPCLASSFLLNRNFPKGAQFFRSCPYKNCVRNVFTYI